MLPQMSSSFSEFTSHCLSSNTFVDLFLRMNDDSSSSIIHPPSQSPVGDDWRHVEEVLFFYAVKDEEKKDDDSCLRPVSLLAQGGEAAPGVSRRRKPRKR